MADFIKSIWEENKELSLRLRRAKQVLFFSSYLPPQIKKLLLRLCSIHKFTLAIISGRSLDNIKELVGIDHIYYVGNHGLELLGPDGYWVLPEAEGFRPLINRLSVHLGFIFKDIPGLKIESKGLSLSIIDWSLKNTCKG